MELLYILLFLILSPFIYYWLKPRCPSCNKKVFKTPEVLDRKYTDTTPRKKDGSHDRRYNTSGYSSDLKKWTCKCGHSWQRWVRN